LPGGKAVSFTFLNFLGANRDVMTLAHELGHGVHGLLAGETQGPLLQHAPIALCETASVFGEMTTFNHLRADLERRGDREPMLALVMDKLDDVMNTVVRQIGFSNFERRLHGWDPATGVWGPARKRSVEELDAVWIETAQELYGKPGEVFTYENAEHLWAYISHFHRPFYVYGYAFGELLTQSLYAERPKLGERFEPLYIEMLRAGGSKDAVELLRPFGLDPTDPSFWEAGIAVSMGALIAEAETLAGELKLI
jgi:oligoendopeptidase F